MFDYKHGNIRLPREVTAFPPICTICLKESYDLIKLQGSGHNVESAFLSLASVAYYAELPIVVCRQCQRADLFRTMKAVTAVLIGLVAGGLIAGLSREPGSIQSLVGVTLALLGPIAALVWHSKNAPPLRLNRGIRGGGIQ